MTPHKHADVIKAWADGATIQVRVHPESEWRTVESPSWDPDLEYRVKPPSKVLNIRLAQLGRDSIPEAIRESGWRHIVLSPRFIRWLTPPIPISYEEPLE